MRRCLVSLILSVLIIVNLTATTTFAVSENNIKIYVDGKILTIEETLGKPFIDHHSRTQIPVRAVAENLGHKVSWEQETKRVLIDDGAVTLSIGSNKVITSGEEMEMDTEATTINGRTFVPLRFVAECLGYEVKYSFDEGFHKIDINSPLKGEKRSNLRINTSKMTVEKLEDYLEELMEKEEIPALSATVFKNSDIIVETYLGKADIENYIDLNENHIFLIASVSKTITATALMQLYEKGLFDLDDPINDYLDFNVENPWFDTPITFKMLLTHTSSIADSDILDEQYYYMQDSLIELSDFMEQYFSVDGAYYDSNENFYDFEPGEDFEYSNTGSALIGVLVESISGQGFNEYCKENIFKPLNMNNTYWKLKETNIDRVVIPYNSDLTRLEHYTFTDYPNGGLRTNSSDLVNFLSIYCNSGMFGDKKILKAETIEKMLNKTIPNIDPTVGLHFFNSEDQYDLWGHTGGEEGVTTEVIFNKDTGIGVIVLCNKSDVDFETLIQNLYELGK